jgi:RHH-type transcriptional regulator, proline utilization regulon repressor / proline dehydrogenase / delta 1-pyrroline-5-carboxylate dehydrogenase
VQGVPRFFSMLDRTLLRGFQSFGSYLPGVAVPMVKEKMQRGDGQRHPARPSASC